MIKKNTNKVAQFVTAVAGFVMPALLANTLVIPDINVATPEDIAASNKGFSLSLDNQEIQQSNPTSITDMLDNHPVLQIKSHSANQTQDTLSLHGFGDNAGLNTLYMIDDTPYISVSEIGPNLNTLLPGSISTLTLLPGSYGALYGDQAVGGVININTDIPPDPVANLTFSIGNQHQYGTSLLASDQDDSGLGVRFGGSFYNNDHYQPHNQQQDYLLNVKVANQGDTNNSDFSVIAYHSTLDMPQSYTWGEPEPTTEGTTTNDAGGYLLHVNNDKTFHKDWHWKSHVLWFDDDTSSTQLSDDDTQNSILWDNNISDNQYIKTGLTLNYDWYGSTNSKVEDSADEYTTTAYSRLTLPIGDQLTFNLGGRYALQGINATPNEGATIYQHNDVFVDEQSFDWKPVDTLRFYLRRDTNFRMPKGKEELWSSDGSVNELKMQTGTAYETGVSYKRDENSVNLGLYQLDIDNELAYSVLPLPYGEMTNLPPTRRIGMDVTTEWYLSTQWSTTYEMTIVDPTFRSGTYQGNQIPAVSKFNGGLGLTYHELYQQWFATITETYHSDQYASDDLANSEPEMPGYWLTNVNFKKQWNVVSLGLRIDNVFNNHYVRYAQYQSFDGSIQYYPADGITLLATLDVNLEKIP